MEKKQISVSEEMLPLCCPLPDQTLWNAHPRIFLPIEANGHIVCPYCSTEYICETPSY